MVTTDVFDVGRGAFRTRAPSEKRQAVDKLNRQNPPFLAFWPSKCSFHDRYLVCTLPDAAPEIVLYKSQYYIAALNQGALDSIRIAKIKWAKK